MHHVVVFGGDLRQDGFPVGAQPFGHDTLHGDGVQGQELIVHVENGQSDKVVFPSCFELFAIVSEGEIEAVRARGVDVQADEVVLMEAGVDHFLVELVSFEGRFVIWWAIRPDQAISGDGRARRYQQPHRVQRLALGSVLGERDGGECQDTLTVRAACEGLTSVGQT